MINTEPNKSHQYSLRSCLNCILFDSCMSKKNKNDSRLHCDFAKYGCVDYQGKYINELSKAEILGIDKDTMNDDD